MLETVISFSVSFLILDELNVSFIENVESYARYCDWSFQYVSVRDYLNTETTSQMAVRTRREFLNIFVSSKITHF